jgi:hypothetical protein
MGINATETGYLPCQPFKPTLREKNVAVSEDEKIRSRCLHGAHKGARGTSLIPQNGKANLIFRDRW